MCALVGVGAGWQGQVLSCSLEMWGLGGLVVVGAHQGSSGRSPWHGLGVGPGALVACFEVGSLFAWECPPLRGVC